MSNVNFENEVVNTENKDLVRDVNSKALLETNYNKLKLHRHRVAQMKNVQKATNEINNLQEQVDSLSNDMTEIKMLLQQLIGNQ